MAEAVTLCALTLSGSTSFGAWCSRHHGLRPIMSGCGPARRSLIAGIHQRPQGGVQARGHLLRDLPGAVQRQLRGLGLQAILVGHAPGHLPALVGAGLDRHIQNLGAIRGRGLHAPALLHLELALGLLRRGPVLVGVLLHRRDALRLTLNGILRNRRRLQRRGDGIRDLRANGIGRILVCPVDDKADLHRHRIRIGVGVGAGGDGDGAVVFADHDLLRVAGDRYRGTISAAQPAAMRLQLDWHGANSLTADFGSRLASPA